MPEKKLTQEQVETLQKCKTKEEVEKFAKDNQLTDEELEKVVGGRNFNAQNGSAMIKVAE